jgi:hypothetical protein
MFSTRISDVMDPLNFPIFKNGIVLDSQETTGLTLRIIFHGVIFGYLPNDKYLLSTIIFIVVVVVVVVVVVIIIIIIIIVGSTVLCELWILSLASSKSTSINASSIQFA